MDIRKQDPEFYATVVNATEASRLCKSLQASLGVRAHHTQATDYEGWEEGFRDVWLIPPHPLCVEKTLQRIFG